MTPGAPLVLTVDAGGERWTLEGRAVHAGEVIEVLAEASRAPCATCDGEGRVDEALTVRRAWVAVGESTGRARCPDCDGRGYLFAPAWWPARFEYRNAGDGTGPAFLYLPLAGGGFEVRHAVEVRAGDGMRFRWPAVRP